MKPRTEQILGVPLLRSERLAFVQTMASLSEEEFEHGTTLCAQWTPRDVFAHVIRTGDLVGYLRGALRVNAVNAEVVAGSRSLPREELMRRGQVWAERPALPDVAGARFFVGDVSIHHQDVLRGLGRQRPIPPEVGAAILREGVVLSTGTKRNLLRYRVVPTTVGGRPLGRGREVRGTSEALGLWLAGRRDIAADLDFD